MNILFIVFMNVKLIIIFLILYSGLIFAQKTKIVKIYDTNLFQGKNGELLRLANIEVPSLYGTDSMQQYVAQSAMKFAELNLLNRLCHYEVSTNQVDHDIVYVHLFRKYPLQNQNINKEYLQQGYGKYIQNQDSSYHQDYQKAEQKARERGKGVWYPHKFVRPKYTLGIFYGYGIGNKNYDDSQYREHWLLLENQSVKNKLSLLIGRMYIAAEGSGCCECPEYHQYYDYRVHYRLDFLRLKYLQRWKYFAYEIGLMGAYDTPGWCEEMGSIFLFPVGQIQIGLIEQYYIFFAYPDEFAFVQNQQPKIIGGGYKLPKKYSEILLGAGKLGPYWALLAKIDYLVYKNVLVKTQMMFQPRNQGHSFRLNLGYLF